MLHGHVLLALLLLGSGSETGCPGTTTPDPRPGQGQVTGTVLGHDGSVLAYVRLVAEPQADVDAGVRSSLRRSTWTDEHGRFVFTIPADTEYGVRVFTSLWGVRPVEPTLRAGARDVVLRPSHPRLVVHIRGRGGRPQPVGCGYFADWDEGADPAHVVVAIPVDGRGEPLDEKRLTTACEAGLGWVTFDLDPGTYRIECRDEARTHRDVTLASGTGVTELDLVLPEPVTIGGLSVTVRDPDGVPYREENKVIVRDAAGQVVARRRYHSGALYRRGLLPGDYRVRVTADEDVPTCGVGWTPRLAPFGPVEVPVTVRAGEEATVDVRLWRGGRLRVHLDLPGEPTSPLLANALDPGQAASRCNRVWAALEPGRDGPAVSLVAVSHEQETRQPLLFTLPGCALNYTALYALPGFTTLTDTLLRPGRYTLLVEDETWAATPIEVLVAQDEVTEVVLVLSAK